MNESDEIHALAAIVAWQAAQLLGEALHGIQADSTPEVMALRARLELAGVIPRR